MSAAPQPSRGHSPDGTDARTPHEPASPQPAAAPGVADAAVAVSATGAEQGAAPSRPATLDEAMAAADLPASLDALVRTTVRRTRLRRAEKAEVARELALHLRAGLDAGEAPSQLAARFGDPKAVAPMLRRAARAKRSAPDRLLAATGRTIGVALLTLVAVYLASAAWLWRQKPVIAFDPLERINAMLPDPAGRPAWPLYKDGLRWHKELQAARAAARAASQPRAAPNLPRDPAPEPGATLLGEETIGGATRAEDAAALRAHQKEIGILREAASLPALGLPYRTPLSDDDAAFHVLELGAQADAGAFQRSASGPASQFPALGMILPELATLRRAARLLAADAWLAIDEGDGDRAAADFIAILGAARHAEQGGTVISQLVATAIRDLAAQQVAKALAERPEAFDDQTLAELAQALGGAKAEAGGVNLEGERIAFEDMVQRLYSDDGEGGGVFLPDSAERLEALVDTGAERPDTSPSLQGLLSFSVGPAAALLEPDRRAVLDAHAELFEALRQDAALPPWDPAAGSADEAFQRIVVGGTGGLVLRLLAPALGTFVNTQRMSPWRLEAAEIAVALERFRRAHGAWPESLDELVPEFLAETPLDPFDGQPLRYELRDGAPIVWSIGNDRADDGGTPPPPPTPGEHRPEPWRWTRPAPPLTFIDPRSGAAITRPRHSAGDWILWPPGS